MINKAKLALIAAVAAVSVVSPALAQIGSASPFETKASVQGVAQSSHFNGQRLADHQFRHQRAFGQWPWYAYYDVPPYTSDYDTTFSTPETAPTQPAVGCQHSEQTVKVPSENGGVREVTILRC